MKIILLPLTLCLFLSQWSFAQSDDCVSAPELAVYNDCRRSPGNTKGLNSNTTTNTCDGNTDDDGWFKFTAVSGRTQVSLSTDQLTDMGIAIFKNCATEIGCIDGKGVGGQEIIKFDTEIGEIYFIQVYEVNEGGAEFLICVSALDPIECLDPIKANFNLIPPNCTSPTSGSIEVDLIDGGITPFTYQIDENPPQNEPLFSNLMAGQYNLLIENELGCQLDTLLELEDTNPLTLYIGEDLLVNQGETVNLQANYNVPTDQIESIEWSGTKVDNCLFPCQTISFEATEATTIQATLTTIDGCQIRDKMQLTLPPKVAIYIPSVFSPNGDGINDFFTIFTSESISTILSLQIADRWGNLVFQRGNFPPNQVTLGWDGRIKNQPLNSQTFIYFVEIELPDNTTKSLSGEIFLVR